VLGNATPAADAAVAADDVTEWDAPPWWCPCAAPALAPRASNSRLKDVAGGMDVTPCGPSCCAETGDTPFTALIDMVFFLWLALGPMDSHSDLSGKS
jgi:hypothetical protein